MNALKKFKYKILATLKSYSQPAQKLKSFEP